MAVPWARFQLAGRDPIETIEPVAVDVDIGEELIRTNPVRHDRTREHVALANPGGRPRRINAA